MAYRIRRAQFSTPVVSNIDTTVTETNTRVSYDAEQEYNEFVALLKSNTSTQSNSSKKKGKKDVKDNCDEE